MIEPEMLAYLQAAGTGATNYYLKVAPGNAVMPYGTIFKVSPGRDYTHDGSGALRVVTGNVNRQVAASADDGWTSGVFLTRVGAEIMVGFGQNLFARFQNVLIPQGAIITAAKIRYMGRNTVAVYPSPNPTTINFELIEDSIAVVDAADYWAKVRTANSVDWDIRSWVSGGWQDTPDVSAMVQEIVNLPGWNSGNAMTVLHEDDGSPYSNEIRSWDHPGNVSGPILIVEWRTARGKPFAASVMQVSCWGKTYRSAKEVADDVIFAMEGWAVVEDEVQAVFLSSETDFYEDDTKTHHIALQFIIWHTF